ncbi:MAG: RNA polymerase sigma factor [Ignavibacteriales bacterium]|nr:RNA polymerase sigma factor [Ignavibacteriales bacterium]
MERSAERTLNIPSIVRRAQGGDTAAFELVYREHVGTVYALCLRMVADAGRAEELTQDVFVKVWQSLAGFRGESAFSSWLHRVAVNVVLTDIRSGRRYGQYVMSVDNLEQHDRGGPEAGSNLDLEDAIRNLPPQARAIFVLHDIEGFKHQEIAKAMDIAVGTAKAQLHRARKLLREALRQ